MDFFTGTYYYTDYIVIMLLDKPLTRIFKMYKVAPGDTEEN